MKYIIKKLTKNTEPNVGSQNMHPWPTIILQIFAICYLHKMAKTGGSSWTMFVLQNATCISEPE